MAHIQVVFNSYEEALAACGSGYDSDDIAKVVTLKTKALAATLHETPLATDPAAVIGAVSCLALARAQAHGRPFRIIDLGGAAGYHYLCTRRLLGDAAYRWTVVETPAMVRTAAPLMADDRLRFLADLEEALEGGVDLIVCSGTLQYMPQPEAVLQQIRNAKPRHVVLARLPVFEGPSAVGLQQSRLSSNGAGPMPAGIEDRVIRYPVTFLPISALAPYLAEYRVVQRYESPSANYLIGETPIPGMTFVLEHME